MINPLAGYPKINEAAKDLLTATLGLALLRAAGMKFEVGQLNMKTFAFGALISGAAGAAGREAYNYQTGCRAQHQKDMYKLATLATFAAGALALTQYDRVSSLARLPEFTQFASRNQGIAVAAFTITSMVACRYFGITNPKAAPKVTPFAFSQPLARMSHEQLLEEKARIDHILQSKDHGFTTMMAKEFNAAAADSNKLNGSEEQIVLFKVST